ncbi:hypothetical protein ABZ682_22790 [Streptomyces griseoviridis]
MSAASEQDKARDAYRRGQQQREDGKLADGLARSNGAASAQSGGRR